MKASQKAFQATNHFNQMMVKTVPVGTVVEFERLVPVGDGTSNEFQRFTGTVTKLQWPRGERHEFGLVLEVDAATLATFPDGLRVCGGGFVGVCWTSLRRVISKPEGR